MKKNYPNKTWIVIALCFFAFNEAFSQLVPVMQPIQGPSAVCANPAAPKTFSVSASNSPNFYSWTVTGPGSGGVVISNPSGSITTIGFPYPTQYATYTISCNASNSVGNSATSSTFVVSVYETPSVTFSGSQSFCQGSSTNLSASPTILSASSTLSYNWSPATGLSSTNSYSVHANPPSTTNYTVLLTLGTCTNSAQLTVQVINCPPVGINSYTPDEKESLQFYPNPSNGSFIIKSTKNKLAVILNELGQTMRTLNLQEDTEIKIEGLAPGVYFVVTPQSRKKIIVTQN